MAGGAALARRAAPLRELLVVHKLEWSEAEMRRREELEDAGNVRLVQLGIPNVSHQHVRARLSRRVVAALGAAAAPAAACGHESALARPRVRCERQPTAGALPGLPGWTRCVVEQKRRRGPPARLCIPFCELPGEPGARHRVLWDRAARTYDLVREGVNFPQLLVSQSML